MSSRISERKILVTGAGRGIGRAIVQALVEAGSEVYGLDVVKENLDSLVKELPTVHPVHVDLADWEATRREVDKLGPLDGLVNNAGITGIRGSCLDAEKEDLQKVVDINLLATINVSQVVGKKMVEAGNGGSIVNISGIAAKVAFPLRLPYSVSKAGVDTVTKQFATELGPHNIRVNSVNPSVVQNTAMSAASLSRAGTRGGLSARTPMKDVATVQEVVGPVLHLLSDQSTAVTGTCYKVDGGLDCCCLP